jgi:hypothetical protein
MAAESAFSGVPCCCMGGFFLLFGGSLAWYGGQQYILLQKMKNTPTSKVRSAAAGLVELFGKAKCKEPMESPISKAKCIYWNLNCEYYYTTRKSSGWRTFYSKHSSNQFFLEDDTGKMLVDPKDAQFNIPADFHSQGHMSDKAVFGLIPQKQLAPNVLEWLERDPPAKSAFIGQGGRDLRVTESFIAEDDPLYVLGSAEPIPGAMSDVKSENLMMKKGNDKILFITDSAENKFQGMMGIASWIYLILGLALFLGSLLAILASFAGIIGGL